jgi:hypothetical protein
MSEQILQRLFVGKFRLSGVAAMRGTYNKWGRSGADSVALSIIERRLPLQAVVSDNR